MLLVGFGFKMFASGLRSGVVFASFVKVLWKTLGLQVWMVTFRSLLVEFHVRLASSVEMPLKRLLGVSVFVKAHWPQRLLAVMKP